MNAVPPADGAPGSARAGDADSAVRLFVALWPDDGVRAALIDSAARWAWRQGTARESAQRLHLTLHFLGSVARDRIGPLRGELALAWRPFDLSLAQATLWSGGIAVLEPADVVQPLADLHAALGAALRRLGLRTEARAFRPHVTLARRAAGASPPGQVAPVHWRVDAYALVASPGAGAYEVVQVYRAGAAPSLEQRQRATGAHPLQ